MSAIGWRDGEINFYQDKPKGDTIGPPQSCAPFGLASQGTESSPVPYRS